MKVLGVADIQITVKFDITESEARALDALVGYGFVPFKTAFYEKLGKAYMEQHEDGLKSFFESIKDNIPHLLSRADNARKVFRGEMLAAEKLSK